MDDTPSTLIHLVFLGDPTEAPCRRCSRTIRHMSADDDFTLKHNEATCPEPA